MCQLKTTGLALTLLFCSAAVYAQAAPPRLIVRSDDMGAFHSINLACIDTYKKGVATTIEVLAVAPWFPEAVKLLRENPGVDVGLHLAITSEWEALKWRPLTHCPSLTDSNGYFFPMMQHNDAYPAQAVAENAWKLKEIEGEFRAQIELALKNVPQISHLSGHMGCVRFNKDVSAMAQKLAAEYNLTLVEGDEGKEKYNAQSAGYNGSNKTAEKEASFLKMLDGLQPAKSYIFLDHPAYNNEEMKPVWHKGYEWVAEDRQGVTDLFTSDNVRKAIKDKGIKLISYNELTKSLPRSTPEAEGFSAGAVTDYLAAVKESGQDLHSLMVLRHGKVIAEHWLGEAAADKPHILNSVSKTFTATAVGFAVAEKRLTLADKVVSFFPDHLPDTINQYGKDLTVKDLLTMSVGHDVNKLGTEQRAQNPDWIKLFLSIPITEKPGTQFAYNSMATYALSAIVQKVSGQKLMDYLYPRLFRPLGIVGARWEESPQGINTGGWGLFVKTEDMAKLGQFILQKGKWNGKQLLSPSWFEAATRKQIASLPAGVKKEDVKTKPEDSDWLQGYGYQMWVCRHNAYRADGKDGQFIVILPEKDAVIVTTANISDMQAELNLVWKHLLPAFK